MVAAERASGRKRGWVGMGQRQHEGGWIWRCPVEARKKLMGDCEWPTRGRDAVYTVGARRRIVCSVKIRVVVLTDRPPLTGSTG